MSLGEGKGRPQRGCISSYCHPGPGCCYRDSEIEKLACSSSLAIPFQEIKDKNKGEVDRIENIAKLEMQINNALISLNLVKKI